MEGNKLEPVDCSVRDFHVKRSLLRDIAKGSRMSEGTCFQIVRLIKEFETKPKVLFLENVKNFRTHDKTLSTLFLNILNVWDTQF